MLIVCPSCACAYEVEPRRLSRHDHNVRCCRCRTLWRVPFAAPPVLQGQQLARPSSALLSETAAHCAGGEGAALEGARSARKAGAAGRRVRQSTALLLATPAVLVGLILGAATARTIPRWSAAVARLAAPHRGLTLYDVKSFKQVGGSSPVLVVEGKIGNAGTAAAAVPRLRIAVRDHLGRQTYAFTVPPVKSVLTPGASLPFNSQVVLGTREATAISLRFVPDNTRLAERQGGELAR